MVRKKKDHDTLFALFVTGSLGFVLVKRMRKKGNGGSWRVPRA